MRNEMTTYLQSDVADLKSVLIKHAKDAFVSNEAIERQWKDLNYGGAPELGRASAEYDRFVSLLARFGVETHFLPQKTPEMDSMYTRDASLVCQRGVILGSMGKGARRGEPAEQAEAFAKLGVEVCGAISGDGRLEGGDVVWLGERVIAVGRGYRTNGEGTEQLRVLLGDCIDELIVVDLVHWRGPDDVFHLMSVLSPIDRDLMLVYSPLLPVSFRESLLTRGFELVEVPDEEFESMGCNVLAVGPRKCVMLSGNPQTRLSLERAGAEVFEFEGKEICRKGRGGPTCLTRPIVRM